MLWDGASIDPGIVRVLENFASIKKRKITGVKPRGSDVPEQVLGYTRRGCAVAQRARRTAKSLSERGTEVGICLLRL
jgi:hypothetical protein